MIKDRQISLVVPVRNEAKNIKALLKRIPAYVDEVVVVNNKSTDKTAGVAMRMGAVVMDENRVDSNGIGYGYALRTGIEVAQGDYIITMDGDGTYPLEQIEEVVNYANKNNINFVSCNRFPLRNDKAISLIRKLGIWVLNTEVRLLYGYKIQDILSGMWVINKTAVKHLQLNEGGWNLSPEIKIAAISSKKIRFAEFHINHERREHEGSKQRIWQTGFDHLWYLLKRRIYENFGNIPILLPSFGR